MLKKHLLKCQAKLAIEKLETRNLMAAGFVGPVLPAVYGPIAQSASASAEDFSFPAVNLAKFQLTSADSSGGGTNPSEATDGVVSNDSRWYSDDTGPHWLEVQLKAPYPVGSAHVYMGLDNDSAIGAFEIQFHDGSSWQTAASVSGNNRTELNIVFGNVVENATRFRLHSNAATIRVKEFVLLPPNGLSRHPLGAGVNLNLASQLAPDVSSVYSTTVNHPAIHAVDGWVHDNSRWLADPSSSQPNTIVANLVSNHRVGSIHLYSGSGSTSAASNPLNDFDVEYYDGNVWIPVPQGTVSSGTMTGNSVTGSTVGELVVTFGNDVAAEKIRLTFTQDYGRIRELVVLPSTNSNSGIQGFEIGTSVQLQAKPVTQFADFGDDWYRIASRTDDLSMVSSTTDASLISASDTLEELSYEFLYSYALDAYRIRNQASGRGLEVKDASLDAGAAIVEGDYSAAPHQLWKLEPTSDGFFQIVNVWSGMVLEPSGSQSAVTQQPIDSANNPVNGQEWKPIFLDSYFKKGTGGSVGSYGTGWAYDWGRNEPILNKDQFYAPMQHNRWWPGFGTYHENYADWNSDVKPAFLLGYNEPDRPDQANISVEIGLDLWPKLMAMDVPLVSPAPAQGGEDWWLTPFMDQADDLGYRTDYGAGHWYSGPNVNNIFNHINDIQNDSNGRDVWLTEFSVVDWSGGSGNWSEEDNFNFLIEFLWRAESKANLDKYAVFLFTGTSLPSQPWTKSNPRSDFLVNGGVTAFGKAYAAWDGDTSINDDTPYLLHNRSAKHRLKNVAGATGPETAWVRRDDIATQWFLRDSGNGKKTIQSARDGRMLRWNGSELDYAPAATQGTSVEWSINEDQYGWHNIKSEHDGKFLQLNRTNNASGAPVSQDFQMVATANSGTMTDWFFVHPNSKASDVSDVSDDNGFVNEVSENASVGSPVGVTAGATDPDSGQTVSYALSNDAGGKFAIHPQTGVVTVAGELDFDIAESQQIEITATSTDSSQSAISFTIGILNVPEIVSTKIGDGLDQISILNQVEIRFDSDVVIEDDAFRVVQKSNLIAATNIAVDTQVAIQTPGNQTIVTVTFTSETRSSTGALNDGTYQLTIDHTKIRDAGNSQTMQDDFVIGSDEVDGFFTMYGDFDGDRSVGLSDFAIFRQVFGSGGSPSAFAADVDGDGVVGLADFAQFRSRFGRNF